MSHPLTIVVPTHNRYDRLQRLLTYYRASRAQAPIHLLDSSSDPAPGHGPLQECLADTARMVVRRYPPDTPPLHKMLDGLQQVSSPYVVLWADDDFLIPSALEDSLCVLERDPEVSVVHGQAALFAVEAGRVQWVAPYLQCSVLDGTAAARLARYFQRYFVTFYSVHRTRRLATNFKTVCQPGLDWHTWGELALGALAVMQGKAVALPRLYMIREGHAGMGSRVIQQQRRMDEFDVLTDTAFARDHGTYEMFRDCLTPELMCQDGLTVRQAGDVVKRAFWPYCMRGMEETWRNEEQHGRVSWKARVREWATRVPGLKRAWRATLACMPGYASVVSLDALLRPSSKYHEDFIPIYRTIIEAG